MKPSPTNAAGFTLLEILVALIVFGFLLAGLTQGVQFGLRAFHGQAAMIAGRSDLDAVDTGLRNLIEPMDPGSPLDPPNILGTAHTLVFTTELPAGAGTDDGRHADAALGVDRNHDLVLRTTPHLHAIRLTAGEPIQSDILLYGAESVDFAYWRRQGGWATSWRSRTPPMLLRITLHLVGQKPWPAIVIAPRRGA